MKKQIAILGSTGSIGTQALEVIEEHADLYEVYCLTANNKVELLAEQAHKFKPAAVVIANEQRYDELRRLMDDLPDVKVYAGAKALDEIVEAEPIDMVLTAMVGFAGLSPTIHAIKARKAIALANKETLVVAGELILQLAQQYHTPILPVDSEHSAIFQSLVGEDANEIEKILLTASGGPFRTFTREQLATILWAYEGAPEQSGELNFADAGKVSAYAVQPLLWAKKEGIIGGKPGNLADPQGTATRAEIATIFSNYMK